jgi:hypothetical protein
MKMQKRVRKLHSTLAPIVMLPLLVTVTTGVIYRLSKDWFGLTRDQVHFLMSIHEGEYLGATLEPFYVLLNGLGLLWMLGTGGAMVLQKFRHSKPSAQLTSSDRLVRESGRGQASPQAVKEEIFLDSE